MRTGSKSAGNAGTPISATSSPTRPPLPKAVPRPHPPPPAEGVPPSTRPRHYQIARLLKSLLGSKPDPLILEIGSGYGDVGLLVRPWARFIGYEPSETCSAHALERGLDIRTEY